MVSNVLTVGVGVGVCRPQYAGEKIPTLQEAIALSKELDLFLFVDIKSNRLLVSHLQLHIHNYNGMVPVLHLQVNSSN